MARTPDFQQLIQDVLTEIEKAGDAASEAWLKDPNGPIQKLVAVKIAKLGENMAVPRFVRYAGPGLCRPVHPPGRQDWRPGGVRRRDARGQRPRGVHDARQGNRDADRGGEPGTSAAYVTRESVPADVLEKEKAIYRAQMEHSGKPANVIDKIVEGKLGSFYRRSSSPTRSRSAIRR